MVKNKPRISINKLAEYCEANTLRRKQIVTDAKYPKNFKSTRYSEARKAIKDYLIDLDEEILIDAIEHISKKPNDTDYQISDNRLSIEALDIISDHEFKNLIAYDFNEFDQDNIKLDISGVDVSVNPDLIVTEGNKIGAMKIHITKDGLNVESLNIVAVVLHQYVEGIIANKGQIADFNMCFAFDVFSEQLVPAPSAFKRRMKRVETACEEIALWWDKL